MSDEPTYGNEEPEPEQEPWPKHKFESRSDPNWNHSYTKNGLKYAAKTTIQNEHGISDKQWGRLDLNKIRTERQFNPHNDSYFKVFCIEDILKQIHPANKILERR